MIGLPYGEKNYDNMLSLIYLIPERYGQTDGRTEFLPISRVSLLTRDKSSKMHKFTVNGFNVLCM